MTVIVQHDGRRAFSTKLGRTVCSDNISAGNLVRLILAGISQLGDPPIMRVEITAAPDQQGTVLFDNMMPILHLERAVLGDPLNNLSWTILETLGVSREMVKEMEVAASLNPGYTIVASREEGARIADPDTTIPVGDWIWWVAAE